MKIRETTNGHNSIVGGNAFTIENSGKAFAILTGGIYSDIRTAIIRECFANAYDAHVANGNEHVPFSVTLPNDYSDLLIIEDYGVGMSADQMLGYDKVEMVDGVAEKTRIPGTVTGLFFTTKEDAADQIGGLGMGLKCPLQYHNKTFMIVSTKDGIRNYVTVFINSNGIPDATVTHTETVDDGSTGTKMIITCDRNDYYVFRNLAAQFQLGYDVKPIINYGDSAFDDTYSIIYSGSNWKMIDIPETSHIDVGNNLYIRQGVNYYEVDESLISSYYDKLPVGEHNLRYPMIIDVPINTFDFVASRDRLKFETNDDVVKLKQVVNDAIAEVVAIVDEIKESLPDIPAIDQFVKFKNLPYLTTFAGYDTRNGNSITLSAPQIKKLTDDNPNVKFQNVFFKNHNRLDISDGMMNSAISRSLCILHLNYYNIMYGGVDLPTSTRDRCYRKLRQLRTDGSISLGLSVIVFGEKDDVANMISTLGIDFDDLYDLDSASKNIIKKTKTKVVNHFLCTIHSNGYTDAYSDLNISDYDYVCPVNRNSIDVETVMSTAKTFHGLSGCDRYAIASNFPKKKVIGMRRKEYLEYIKQKDHLPTISDYLSEKVDDCAEYLVDNKELRGSPTLVGGHMTHASVAGLRTLNRLMEAECVKHRLNEIPEWKEYTDLKRKIEKNNSAYTEYSNTQWLYKSLTGRSAPIEIATDDTVEYDTHDSIERLFKRKPMLNLITYITYDTLEEYCQYVFDYIIAQ